MKVFKKFTKEELEGLHLTIVRAIAKEIGVGLVVKKRKEELVEDIVAIQEGKLKPVWPKKPGAPQKIHVDLSEFMEEQKSASEIAIEQKTEYVYVEPEVPRVTFNDSGVAPNESIIEGVLEIHKQGYGFLRVKNYENSSEDAYVSSQNIKKFNLKRGDFVRAIVKQGKTGESDALQKVLEINGVDLAKAGERKKFDDLIPTYPEYRIRLEDYENSDYALRIIDLFAPIGFGQRGLIVAPPKTGKTTILKKIARAIENKYFGVEMIVLLLDERPEEVTDIKEFIRSEVVFSTFDENPEHHIRAAELVCNKAKRSVEMGKDVVILMDSITRLARAYNIMCDSSGKTLSGGLDPFALFGPKSFFGAARNVQNGGSLTILSTALIDTGSRMDDVIYEEFKGTGNLEIHLSRELAERRIFPAIDIKRSGTRKEELLLDYEEAKGMQGLRKILSYSDDPNNTVLEMLEKTKNNKELLEKVPAWLKLYQK